MMEFGYDMRYEPPAPVLPLYVGQPGRMAQTLVFGIVDTGADVVVVPETLATNLELPVIGRTCVVGATGRSVTANVFAVTVELMGNAWIVEAIALGDEALWGRNLVNRFRLTLDGHHLQLQVPR